MIIVVFHAVTASKSFGTSLKGTRLPCRRESHVFARSCAPKEYPCRMQHWWSGGTFSGYADTLVRYYVDSTAAVSVPLGLAHGMAPGAFMEDNGPWSAGTLFGKSGVGLHAGGPSHGSGFFNTIQVPFASRINVTVALGCPAGAEYFWLILRGRTRAGQISLPGGLVLPPKARLRSFEQPQRLWQTLGPFDYLSLLNMSSAGEPWIGGGAVLYVTLAVRSPRLRYEFLEGCVRARPSAAAGVEGEERHEGGDGEWKLSSGTEDYFLGTFYFDKGQYFLPLAGVTALCPAPKAGSTPVGCTPDPNGSVLFSAYRVHAGEDPLMFESEGLAVSWRNGEPGHGGAPATVIATSFALAYVW